MDVLATNKKLYVFALAFSYLKLVQNDLKVIFYLFKNCFDIFQVRIPKNKLLKLITLPPDFAKTKFALSLESLIFNIRFLYSFCLIFMPFQLEPNLLEFFEKYFLPLCWGDDLVSRDQSYYKNATIILFYTYSLSNNSKLRIYL